MPQFRISEAAGLLGVSEDTVRRWVEAAKVTGSARDASNRRVIDGVALAEFAREHAHAAPNPSGAALGA